MIWGILAAVALFAGLTFDGYVIGRALVAPTAPPWLRLTAGGVSSLGLASVIFYALAFFGMFTLGWASAALALATAGAVVTAGRGAGSDLARDVATAWERLAEGPTWSRVLTLTGSLVLLAHLVRAAVAPPLGWDSLTYHLPKAAMWVQSGRFGLPEAPDAWSYYRYFPAGGDLVWAWGLLPLHGDGLLFVAQAATFLAVLLAAYAAARSLGADGFTARLVAIAVAFTPAVANFMGSANVDNLLLALLLASVAFMREAWDRPSLRSSALLGAAVGLAVGVKTSAAPFGALALGWVGVRFRHRPLLILPFVATALVGAPSYLHAWTSTGSPVWPFAVEMFGRTVIPGHPGLVALWHQRGPQDWEVWGYLAAAFTGDLTNAERWNLGYGPLWPLSWLLLLAGTSEVLRRREALAPALWAIGASGMLVFLSMSPSSGALRSTWAVLFPRLLVFAYATALVLGAAWSHRLARPFYGALAVGGMLLSFPRQWSGAIGSASAAWCPWLLLGALLVWFAAQGRQRRRWPVALAAFSVILIPLHWIQTNHRYDIFAQAAEEEVYQAFPLSRRFAEAWPVWEALDDGPPHRVAVAAGWQRSGHNWYLYPLLGTRLQNRVFHVSVTDRERQTTYRALEPARLDRRSWLERLTKMQADRLALLPPAPPEERWARGRLRLLARGRNGRGLLFEVSPPPSLR